LGCTHALRLADRLTRRRRTRVEPEPIAQEVVAALSAAATSKVADIGAAIRGRATAEERSERP
jgi:hypothetical protein